MSAHRKGIGTTNMIENGGPCLEWGLIGFPESVLDECRKRGFLRVDHP